MESVKCQLWIHSRGGTELDLERFQTFSPLALGHCRNSEWIRVTSSSCPDVMGDELFHGRKIVNHCNLDSASNLFILASKYSNSLALDLKKKNSLFWAEYSDHIHCGRCVSMCSKTKVGKSARTLRQREREAPHPTFNNSENFPPLA